MQSFIKLSGFADEAEDSLEGQIAALKRNEISLLELRSVNGKNVKDFTLAEAKGYQKVLSENGIKVWSIGSPIGKTDIACDFATYEQTVRHIFQIANVFQTQRIRVFSFFHAYGQEQKVYDYLNRLVSIAQEYGVMLCHENEKDIFGDTLQRVLRIKENVPQMAFVYDPANYLQVGEKAEDALREVHAFSEYYHIKDVISQTGELVPVGEGDGAIEELVRKITGNKVLSLEPHLRTFAGYAEIDGTQMKNKYVFDNGNDAFDAAANALKELIKKVGYKEINGGFIKE